MKVRVYKRRIKTGSILEDHELQLGRYNEFYLPSVSLDEELWVVITERDGLETKLHLKR